MKKLTAFVTVLLLCAGMSVKADPILKSAKITFIPTVDDKDTDTKVTVTITTKFNNSFDLTLASLNDFAGSASWEDKSGKEYTYDLKIAGGLKLSQVSGDLLTKICINTVGNDTVKFNYRLVLTFQETGGDPIELRQERGEITVSQDSRCWSGN